MSATQPSSSKKSESDLPIDPTITIRAEASLVDPDTCKFTVNRIVHAGGPYFFGSGNTSVVVEAPADAGSQERTDTGSRVVIQKLLDSEVNRSIAMDGGCQGCAASKLTLRQGFELMVRRIAPEIIKIIDTTDHAAGSTPFYR